MTDVYLYFTYISYKNMLKANALITPKQKWEGQRLTNGFNFVAKVEQCLSSMSLAKFMVLPITAPAHLLNLTLKMIERFREINYISIKDRKLQKKIKYKVLNCYLFFKDVYSCNIVDMQILITLTCVTQFFFFCTHCFILSLIIDHFCRKLSKNGTGEKEKPNFQTDTQRPNHSLPFLDHASYRGTTPRARNQCG